jgi:hypothetical protein
MAPRRRLAAITVALVLATPAAALAQSAGDEQYADPFGDGQGQSNDQGSSNDQGASNDQGSSSGSGTTTAQAAPTATPAPATSAPTATTAQAPPATAQLPRTGGDPITPAVAGFWLLLGGVALRVRVRQR